MVVRVESDEGMGFFDFFVLGLGLDELPVGLVQLLDRDGLRH